MFLVVKEHCRTPISHHQKTTDYIALHIYMPAPNLTQVPALVQFVKTRQRI